MDKKKEILLVESMFDKGFLLNQELLNSPLVHSLRGIEDDEEELLVLNLDYLTIIKKNTLVDWYIFDEYKVKAEKKQSDLFEKHLELLKNLNPDIKVSSVILESKNKVGLSDVEVVISYDNVPQKIGIKNFNNIFISRFRFLESILRNRQELSGAVSISRLLNRAESGSVSLIGMVQEKRETKTGHFVVTLEDLTGRIKIIFSKDNEELMHLVKDVVLDEVIGVAGKFNDKAIFGEKIIFPDVPSNNELKTSEIDEKVIFLSDIHVGSKFFLEKEFRKFLRWIKGESGTEEQKKMAYDVKYVFIAGDLVDGVGVYPTQKSELEITDIKEQYRAFSDLIKEIPADKHIIICPGNHDMVHLAEPQPVFYKEYSPGLFEMPNVTLVSNPALINIGKKVGFPGFNVLMYHGYSFDYYVANVDSIRNQGGYHRADLIMKFLLRKRHLAPSFGSTPYFPGHEEDPLLIKKIPDFFISGHIHYSSISNYRGITMICGSCWQGKTSYQEKLGHEPEPGRVPVVNLKNREVKLLKFV